MSSSRQSGSIASFVIIGVVLVSLLFGAIYLSKQRGKTVATGGSTTTDTTPRNTPAPSTGSSQSMAENSPPTAQNKPANPAPQSSAAPEANSVPSTGPSQIAATGADDSLIVRSIVTLAVGLAVASYVTSRRDVSSAALR